MTVSACGLIHVNSRAFTVIRVPKTVRPADSISLVFKQQLPAITQQFFQGNIFMTIAVTLPTIAVDPTRPERQQHIARDRTDRADGLFSVFRVLRGLIFVSREWSRV